MTTAAIPDYPSLRGVLVPVGAGHFLSHFFMLLLPPLFPLLGKVYGVGFTELGLAFAVFSLTAAVTEAPIGFLVDKLGPVRILIVGVVVHSLAIAAIGLFDSYAALLVLMAICGLAHAIYHPADYSILNARVRPEVMGRAFSIHTASGFLGQAVAPVSVITLTAWFNWQIAIVVCGACGLLIALVLATNRTNLAGAARTWQPAVGLQKRHSGVRLLLTLPVLMGFLFYLCIALAGQGINGFSVSSLHLIYEQPISEVTIALSAYLFAAPVGVLAGGWLADRTQYHHRIVAGCFALSAACVFVVASLELPLAWVAVLLMVAGFGTGVVAPSRDMLIRAITPAGDVGKVFGFVSSGFALGGVLAPVAYGYVLDTNEPRLVFWLSGALWLLTIVTVIITARVGRRARAV